MRVQFPDALHVSSLMQIELQARIGVILYPVHQLVSFGDAFFAHKILGQTIEVTHERGFFLQ